MGLFDNFPYSNRHELNLDWILAEIQKLKEKFVFSVNGKTGEVVLSATDVDARPDTWTPTAIEVGARADTWTPTAAEVSFESSSVDYALNELLNHTAYDVVQFFTTPSADDAPSGYRAGLNVVGQPSQMSDWILFNTIYYDKRRMFGWQIAFDMASPKVAYRYRRNGEWFAWAYFTLT